MSHDISVVIADMGSGGAQRVVSLLAKEWSDAGLRVGLITLSEASTDFFRVDPRVTRICIGGLDESTSLLRALGANRARIKSLRGAIVHSGAPVVISFVGATNILTILAARSLDVRVVISERNDPARQSLGRAWDLLRRRLYRKADVVTANSEGALRALNAFVPAAKLRLVHNPVAQGGQRDPEPGHILFVGRLVAQKGIDVLLDAMATVVSSVPTGRLTIVGGGELEGTLRAQADRLKLGDSVRWIGVTDDLAMLWRTAQVFVLPSRYEGTPNALLEAMAWGLPCAVTTGVGGALDLVEDRRSALVVPIGDVEALADAIVELLRDQALADRVGNAAKEAVEDLTPAVVARRWLALLNIERPAA